MLAAMKSKNADLGPAKYSMSPGFPTLAPSWVKIPSFELENVIHSVVLLAVRILPVRGNIGISPFAAPDLSMCNPEYLKLSCHRPDTSLNDRGSPKDQPQNKRPTTQPDGD